MNNNNFNNQYPNQQNGYNNNYYNNYQGNNNQPKKDNSYGKTSLIIGIVAFILSFFINFLILPLAITGLVLGILSTSSGKKVAGILLNLAAIVVVFTMIFLVLLKIKKDYGFRNFLKKIYHELEYQASENYIVGKYNCTGVDDKKDEYLVTLYLNDDNTFTYGPYGDLDNNHVKGKYTFEDEKKTNASGEFKYFMVTMTGNKADYIVNGKSVDHDFESKMEFGVTKLDGKKQGVIMFLSSYNMYYCYEQ